MAYQSEAALEQQFIEQLNKQEYNTVSIPDYDALVANFKKQFEMFNASKLNKPLTEKEWERIFNLMLGKSVFQSAKILRDKFILEREDGTKVYLSFFDTDHTKNIFQVTNQTTVVGKYVNRYASKSSSAYSGCPQEMPPNTGVRTTSAFAFRVTAVSAVLPL